MRTVASALLTAAVFVIVIAVTASNRVELDPFVRDYVVQNFQEDTRAKNAVASILLNYRVYDTMFEALILLAAIIGMNQFIPHAQDRRLEPEDERDR